MTNAVNDAVRQIWAQRRESVLGRVAVLERAAAAQREGRLDEGLRADAAAEAHKLAGSAGSYGFPEASRMALELESLYESPREPVDSSRTADLTRDLRAQLEGEPAPAGTGA